MAQPRARLPGHRYFRLFCMTKAVHRLQSTLGKKSIVDGGGGRIVVTCMHHRVIAEKAVREDIRGGERGIGCDCMQTPWGYHISRVCMMSQAG